MIDPHVELAFWRELAWDTYQRGHHKLAREIWGTALNEHAALTDASTSQLADDPARVTSSRKPEREVASGDMPDRQGCKPASDKPAELKGAKP